MEVRADLLTAQHDAWDDLVRPGPCLSGEARRELALTALAALTSAEPLPPWVAPSTLADVLPHRSAAPTRAHDAVYRIAAHAGTLTIDWYNAITTEVGELAYVELVALTCTVAAVWSFRRSAGLDPWPLGDPVVGAPTGRVADQVVHPALNWVPVAAPADQRAAVVQAFTALPSEHTRTWRLADAQYIPDLEMVDPRWTRGPLSRPQMELVATRVAQLRQCFF
jgi:hypothetical protein